MVKGSIIIPCYNYGIYIQDALDSIADISNSVSYEVIIVDDGSTDDATLVKMTELRNKGYHVISHPNKGVAYARNQGIAAASGQYILPLDADNKIILEFIIQAIQLLDSGEYDVVYGKPVFFGEDTPIRKFGTRPFDGDQLFIGNYIDACAMYRKAVWEVTGGYDTQMPYQGHEDWEFWVNAYTKDFKFYFADTDGYHYRIMGGSLMGGNNPQKYDKNHQYIVAKYFNYCIEALDKYKTRGVNFQQQAQGPLRLLVGYLKKLLKVK